MSVDPQHPLLRLENLLTINAFENITGYKYTLHEDLLRAGVQPFGVDKRLQRFLYKWLAGQKVKVAIIGGSVAFGRMASKVGETDFFALFATFLSKALPGSNVTSRNGAVGATDSAYMAMCFDNHVDQDTDLLFVDYCINDGFGNGVFINSSVRSMEQVVRKGLTLPNNPAVVAAMLMRSNIKWEGKSVVVPFYSSMEEAYTQLAQFYGLPSISVRNALYHKVATGQPGFRAEEIFADGVLHPNDYGMRMLADLLVYLVQRTLTDMALIPLDEAGALAPPPLGLTPRPIIRGNWQTHTLLCATDHVVQDYVVNAQGFSYGYEHTTGLYGFHKYGWIAMTPGSKLTVQVPTAHTPGVAADSNVTAVFFGHLRSYQHMGRAAISCISGCSCDAVVVDAHHNVTTSQTLLVRLDVTPHERCQMQVEVLAETSSGEHKFKVISLMVVAATPSTLHGHSRR